MKFKDKITNFFVNKFSLNKFINWSKNTASPWLEKKKRHILILFWIGAIIFILGIVLFLFNKTMAIITVLIGCIIMIVILLVYILTQFLKDPKALVIIISSIVVLIAVSITVGQGILKIVNAYFPGKKDQMIGYYSSLISGVFSGIIGVAGAIMGAKIGADKSYKSAMDSISKQIEYDREKAEKEKQEEKEKAQDMINYLLKYEITYNFQKIICFESKNMDILIKQFRNNSRASLNYLSGADEAKDKCFKFDEFNNIKYTYLNYMNEEIIEIYQMFKLLDDKKEYSKLTDQEYKRVRSTYLKYYEKYKD